MDQKFSVSTSIPILNFEFGKSNYYVCAIIIAIAVAILCTELLVLVLRRALTRRDVYPVGYKQIYMPGEFCKSTFRYIIDLVCKVVIFGTTFYLSYTSVVIWNWFKSAINENCHDQNPQMATYVMTPYSELYVKIVQYSVAQCVIVAVVLIVDVVHFRWIYKT